MNTFDFWTVLISLLIIYAGIAMMFIEGRLYFFCREYRSIQFSSKSGRSVSLYTDRQNSLESLSIALDILKENRAYNQQQEL